MPLNTQIIRGDKPLNVQWGGFHIAAMIVAAAADSGKGPWTVNKPTALINQAGPTVIQPGLVFRIVSYPYIAETPLGHDAYTLKADYTFVDEADGEILELKKGDQLIAYRD